MKYRNVMSGRVVERPAEDAWLEASSGWQRVEEPTGDAAPAEEEPEAPAPDYERSED